MPKLYRYEHPRPSVTVDCVAFTIRDGSLRVLLVRRKNEPFAGQWALPGGFLDMGEPVETAARRELREETGLETPWPLDPLGFYGAVDRDPRGRTISLAFATVFRTPAPEPIGGDDASHAAWVPVGEIGDLAFDHQQILETALVWLTVGIETGPVGLALLPEPFGTRDVQDLFRGMYGKTSGATAWCKQLKSTGVIVPEGGWPVRYRVADQTLDATAEFVLHDDLQSSSPRPSSSRKPKK